MDRFRWSQGQLTKPNEESVYEQNSVTVYNLDTRTTFTTGRLQLTSHRLFWHSPTGFNCSSIELELSTIVGTDLKQAHRTEDGNRFNRTYFTRLVVRLDPEFSGFDHLSIIDQSLVRSTTDPFVQFEFEYGGHNEFFNELNQQLVRRHWLNTSSTSNVAFSSFGIRGIERNIQNRLDNQDQKINSSFKDLSVLMNQAKEMVNLSNTITAKLTKKQQTEAETDPDNEEMKKLKGYFSSMGIIDCPVTKESSGSKYIKDLAGEISRSLSDVIVKQGGVMTLSDVFCRLNRARAIAGLVSADDLLNACKELNRLPGCKLKYSVYKDFNLHVLEVAAGYRLEEICEIVEKEEYGMSAYGLSKELKCSLIVARKHLLDGECVGRLCRDETVTGLKFYKNLF